MSNDDDLGTVRWFGESWGAPVCDPRTHIPTPTGRTCLECEQHINEDDQGLTIPHAGGGAEPPPHAFVQQPEGWYVRPFHRFCYMAALGLTWD